jgi:MFS family permease
MCWHAVQQMWPFRLDLFASSTSLFLGIGAFLWIPMSIGVGRRPAFLLCTVILLVATVWAGISGSFYAHLGARCLQGLATGCASSAVSLTLAGHTAGFCGHILTKKESLS